MFFVVTLKISLFTVHTILVLVGAHPISASTVAGGGNLVERAVQEYVGYA